MSSKKPPSKTLKPVKKPLISICIPIFNEEENLSALMARLDNLDKAELEYDFEFLFTDNASTDNGFAILAEMAATDKRIRVLRFSRNFGFQKSILTNYKYARGEAAVQIDADLQDPPEIISEFLRLWETGNKVVYGVRRKRKESIFLNLTRRAYYRLVSWLSQTDLPRNAGDFRLIDRVILNQLGTVDEQTPYLRGLIASIGYKQVGVVYDRDRRVAGRSKFNLFKLIELGIDGITAQSIRPLKLMTMFGFCMSILAGMAIIYYLLAAIFSDGTTISGFTTLVLLQLLLLSMNAFLLGLLGEYVGRIFNNTRGLPLTIIQDRIEQGEQVSKKDQRA